MTDLLENRMIFAENSNIYSIRYDDIIYIEYIDRHVYTHESMRLYKETSA